MTVINVDKLTDNSYKQIDADQLLDSLDDKQASRLRIDITRAIEHGNSALVRCGICKETIYLKAKPFGNEGYYFSHLATQDPTLKKCPQRTEQSSNLALIRALKYQGSKESELHLKTKHLIAKLLGRDKSIGIGSVKIEERLSNHKEYRRPDVQAIHDKRLIAFEVQVSTEFTSAIIAREYFYERFGQILWVLPTFNPDKINQSQRDILTSNNDHLYVFDIDMRQLSEDKNKFHLKTWVDWPKLNNGKLQRDWKTQIITLEDIKFENGHAFVWDVKKQEDSIYSEIKALEKKRDSLDFYQEENEFTNIKNERENLEYEWNQWYYRWNLLCKEIVHPLNQKILKNKLNDIKSFSKQTSSLPGLWLALHDIWLDHNSTSEVAIRALICASNAKLDYGYSSWKYLAKMIMKHHTPWFAPWYNVLKINNCTNAFIEIKSDLKLKADIKELRLHPIKVKPQQKKLLGLIEPKLKIEVPIYSVEPLNYNGPIFLYKNNIETPGQIFPPELFSINYNYRSKVKKEGFSQAIDIFFDLKGLQENNIFLPMPYLPITTPSAEYYYIESDFIDIFLPTWEKQLKEFETELSLLHT